MKTKNKSKRGKLAKAAGSRFELKTRYNLESKGWIVIKNPNNVFFEKENSEKVQGVLGGKFGKFTKGKAKYNPFTKSLMMNSGGMPDFICFRPRILSNNEGEMPKNLYEVIGVECKGGDEKHKYLDKTEKEKCEWILKNKIFSKILVANKNKVGRKIKVEYKEFKCGN